MVNEMDIELLNEINDKDQREIDELCREVEAEAAAEAEYECLEAMIQYEKQQDAEREIADQWLHHRESL
jgi:hypothetical protein